MKDKFYVILVALVIGFPKAITGIPNKHTLEGAWLVAEKNAKISIAPCGDKYCGKITWLNDKLMLEKKERMGMLILKDFQVKDLQTLENGKIYDPIAEKWYNGRLKLTSSGRLEVRGWIGIPALGKSVFWTRN